MGDEEKAKTEPNAELRQMANFMWQMFVALKDEGFTEMQALVMIGQMLKSGGSDT